MFSKKEPLYFTRTRNVTPPTRGTKKSAGIDFYVPNDFIAYALKPQERILIPSGIRMAIPEDMALIAFNKSGVGSKLGLDVLACVIDEDYSGEIHLNVVNTGTEDQIIQPGSKLLQCVLIPVYYAPLWEMEEANLLTIHAERTTERGDGGFGSTDEKK